MHRVSVVISTYNAQNYIERSVYSALEQKFPSGFLDLDVVIIDDHSNDKTHEICTHAFRDESRVSIIRHQEHKGTAASRNRGVQESRGRFLFFLEPEDYIHQSAIFILLQSLILLPSVSGVYSDYVYVNNKEERSQKISALKTPFTGGMLLKKLALYEIGLVNEGFKLFEDEDFIHRFQKFGHELINIPLPLYAVHKNDVIKNLDLNTDYIKLVNTDKVEDST